MDDGPRQRTHNRFYLKDYYCPALRLAIELDGESHNEWGKGWKDRERDTLLREKHGITILRYENKIVYQHPEYIIEDIKKAKREGMDTRPRQPQAAATPSNLEGEKKSDASAISSPKLGEGDHCKAVVEECVKSPVKISSPKLGEGDHRKAVVEECVDNKKTKII